MRVALLVLVLATLLLAAARWIPGRWPARRDLVLYDGTCALCHRVVRFLLYRDRAGTAFLFAPLAEGEQAETVRVQTEAGVLLTHSEAALYLLERVGGPWRVLALAARVLPRRLRDAAYTA